MPKGYRKDGTPLGRKKKDNLGDKDGQEDNFEDKDKQFELMVQERLENLQEELSSLGRKVLAMEDKLSIPDKPFIAPQERIVPTTTETKYPIPIEYQQILNESLNYKFGLKIDYFTDRPEFHLHIMVPDEYSSLTLDEKQQTHIDMRSKVIPFSRGASGVKEWADMVFNSFNVEFKAKIRADQFNHPL